MNFDFLDDGAGEVEDEKILHPGPVDPLFFLPPPEDAASLAAQPSVSLPMTGSVLAQDSKGEPPRQPMMPPVPTSVDEYKCCLKTMAQHQIELNAAATAAEMSRLYYSFRSPRDVHKDLEGILADHKRIYLLLKHLNKRWAAWIHWRKAKALKLMLADLSKKRSTLQNELRISLANQRPTGSLDPHFYLTQCKIARDDFQRQSDVWAKKYAYFIKPSARPDQLLSEDEEFEARARAYRHRHKQ
jgi:hypothetical protein